MNMRVIHRDDYNRIGLSCTHYFTIDALYGNRSMDL